MCQVLAFPSLPLLDIKDLLLAAPSASICLTHLLPVLILEEVAAHTLPVLTVAGSSMGPSALPSRPYRPLSGTLAPVVGRSLIASHGLTQAGPASPGPLRSHTRTNCDIRPLMSVTGELMRTRRLSLEGDMFILLPPPLPFRLGLTSLRNPRFIPLQLSIPSHQLHVMTDASGVGWGLVSPLPLLVGVRCVSTPGRHCPGGTPYDSGLAFSTSPQQCLGTYGLFRVSSGPTQRHL